MIMHLGSVCWNDVLLIHEEHGAKDCRYQQETGQVIIIVLCEQVNSAHLGSCTSEYEGIRRA